MKKIRHKTPTRVIETAHPFEGLPEGDERLAKALLALRINEQIDQLAITQIHAAEILSITQPEVSNLRNGRLAGFTFDRLYRCLNALDIDVQIHVKKRSSRTRSPAGVHVLM